MTARFHTSGSDPAFSTPMTQWQRERLRGPILPMRAERRSIWSGRRK